MLRPAGRSGHGRTHDDYENLVEEMSDMFDQ